MPSAKLGLLLSGNLSYPKTYPRGVRVSSTLSRTLTYSLKYIIYSKDHAGKYIFFFIKFSVFLVIPPHSSAISNSVRKKAGALENRVGGPTVSTTQPLTEYISDFFLNY